jgi:IclR family transcriptional regulator, KDG regulon repressor
MNTMKKANENRYNIRVLERALQILTVLADAKTCSINELSTRLNLSNSTTYRLLVTLINYGYVKHEKGSGEFQLGLSCIKLARSFYSSNSLREQALPDLVSLRDLTKETVHLGILENWTVVYLDKLQGLMPIGIMSSSIGGISPSYCTGLGKILLAYQNLDEVAIHFSSNELKPYTEKTITEVDKLLETLREVRNCGYALDNGDHENEVGCIAAPLSNAKGEVIAAISVSGPVHRIFHEGWRKDLLPSTLLTAKKISEKLTN